MTPITSFDASSRQKNILQTNNVNWYLCGLAILSDHKILQLNPAKLFDEDGIDLEPELLVDLDSTGSKNMFMRLNLNFLNVWWPTHLIRTEAFIINIQILLALNIRINRYSLNEILFSHIIYQHDIIFNFPHFLIDHRNKIQAFSFVIHELFECQLLNGIYLCLIFMNLIYIH